METEVGLDVETVNLERTRCDSLALDVFRESPGLSGVLLMHFLVGGEGLHHLDVSVQRGGGFYSKALVPGERNGGGGGGITLHQFVRAA